MVRMKIGACVVAAAITIGAAGCGGGDDSSSSSATTAASITKDEFVTQGNQICADGNKAVQTAAEQTFSSGKPSKDDLEQFATDSLIPSIQGQIDAIRALGAPEGEEDQVSEFLDAAQADVDKATDDPSLALSNSAFNDVNQLASALGLTECAK
jgi:hypothetical protein